MRDDNCLRYDFFTDFPWKAVGIIFPVRPYLGVGASREATLVGAVNVVLLRLLIVVVVAVA
eukprot:7266736-Pyramimonas_sp.AAC.1